MGIGDMSIVDLSIFFIPMLFLYFLPSFIAWRRNHRNTAAIVVVNLLLGWSFIGWIAALVWAFVDGASTKSA